ncbi:hypothetical protein K7G95_13540 [Escherichia coli]|nr:hypothetical protein K7G95_13540 [Escherichia coli]
MVIILTGTIFQPFKRIFVQQQAPSATLPPWLNSNQRTDFMIGIFYQPADEYLARPFFWRR